MKTYIRKTIKFYDENVDKYVKNTINLQDVEWLEKFVSYLFAKSKILDVGCSYGRDCKFFVEKGFDTYGIDLSKKMIEKAKEFVPCAKCEVMDMNNLKFENASFNGIWCSAALIHLAKEDVTKVLKEFYRILRRNGILYLNLKFGTGEKIIEDNRYEGKEKFYSYFQENEIKKLLKDQNLKIIDFAVMVKKEKYMKDGGLIYLLAKK